MNKNKLPKGMVINMFRKRKNENMAYGVIGLGRFGYALATELAGSGAELLVICLLYTSDAADE